MKTIKNLAALGLCAMVLGGGVALLSGCNDQPEQPTPAGTAISTVQELQDAFTEGGTYYLANDLTYLNTTLKFESDVTLDFNGHTLNVNFDEGQAEGVDGRVVPSYVFNIVNGGSLTLNATNGGGVNSNWSVEFENLDESRSVAPYVFQIGSGSNINAEGNSEFDNTVTINGGNFVTTDSIEIVNLIWGTVNVTGGLFEMKYTDTEWGNAMNEAKGTRALLNRVDSGNSAYKSKSISSETYEEHVKIVVTGGRFKGFDPQNMTHDPVKPTSYVPEGYESNLSGEWYTVSKIN